MLVLIIFIYIKYPTNYDHTRVSFYLDWLILWFIIYMSDDVTFVCFILYVCTVFTLSVMANVFVDWNRHKINLILSWTLKNTFQCNLMYIEIFSFNSRRLKIPFAKRDHFVQGSVKAVIVKHIFACLWWFYSPNVVTSIKCWMKVLWNCVLNIPDVYWEIITRISTSI